MSSTLRLKFSGLRKMVVSVSAALCLASTYDPSGLREPGFMPPLTERNVFAA